MSSSRFLLLYGIALLCTPSLLCAQSNQSATVGLSVFDHYTETPIESSYITISYQDEILDSAYTDASGNAVVTISITTGVQREETLPHTFSLSHNYPNPFSSDTNVELSIPEEQTVQVVVYNVLGQQVATERVSLSAGFYTLNLSLAHLPTGVYFVRAIGTESHTVKIAKTGRAIHAPGQRMSVQPGRLHQRAVLAKQAEAEYTIRVYKERYDVKEIVTPISESIAIDVPMERNNEVILIVMDEDDTELEYDLNISGDETNISILTPDTLLLKSGYYTVQGSTQANKVDIEIEIASNDTTLIITAQPSSPVAGTLYPGKFMKSLNGIGIGAHYNAIVDSVSIEVEWIDPADDPLFPSNIDWIQRIDRFVEIRAVNNENEGIDPPIGTGFLIAIPVPEDFDEMHLYPLEYTYGVFAPHSTAEINYWMPTSGVFDPKHRVFLFSVPAIGSSEYPTRLGIIEHKTFETLESAEILDQILNGTFNNPDDNNTFNQQKNSSDFNKRSEAKFTSSTIHFNVIRLGGPIGLWDTIRQALRSAYDVYNQQLYNNPEPRLKRNINSWMPGQDTFYTYYIHDENTSVIPLIPDGWIGELQTCPTVHGFYIGVTGTGVTCSEATNHTRTTHHELFHAFQWGYNSPWTIPYSYIVEGTARLAENIDDPLGISGRESPSRVDVRLDVHGYGNGEKRPYLREYFFYDLFHRAGLSFEDMGKLLNVGLRTEHLDTFIKVNTSYDGLGEAYWRWARNAAFEADIDPDGKYESQCLFNIDAADLIAVTVEPDTADVAVIEHELQQLTSGVFKITLEPDNEPYDIVLDIDADDPGIWYKFYQLYNIETDECWADSLDNQPQTFTVNEEKVNAYLLVSNTIGYQTEDDDHEVDDTLSVMFRVIASPPEIGIPGPAISLSVGLDPTLIEGDDFGGLAGTHLDLFPTAQSIYDSQPPDLPRLQFDPGCDFYTGGIDLGLNGPSGYFSQVSYGAMDATAAMEIQAHEKNSRITVDFSLTADAVPLEVKYLNWAAMSGTQGADPFGIPSNGVFLVLDVSNFGLHNMEILIEWNLTGELGGDPGEAMWDGLAMYRLIPECGGLMSPPVPLFDVIDGAGNPSGSRSIQLGNVLSSQIVLEIDVGIIANATGEIRDGDGVLIEPSTQSNGTVEGFIEISINSVGL